MTPILKVALTLTGALAAGLPLLWLTATPPQAREQENAPATAATTRPVHVSMYFSGEPIKITLFHNAEDIASFSAPITQHHFTLELPISDTLEIEYEVEWPENAPGMKGFTLHLEPEGMDTRSETMWTMPEDSQLHDIFYFRW